MSYARPKSRYVAYLEEHGRSTAAQMAKALGVKVEGIHSRLRALERAGHIEVLDEMAGAAKLWDVPGAPAPDREPAAAEITQQAIASQPALATVWRRLATEEA